MTSQPCARAIYWRARPGQLQAYSDYLREQVEPIDEEARRHGALRHHLTLVDPTPGAAWTHMRLFTFDNPADRSNLRTALAAAAAALTPDPEERARRSAYAASLRDSVGESDFDLLGPA